MSLYRYSGEPARADDVALIEDASLIVVNADGSRRPGFRFIDGQTVKAHPVIIDELLHRREAERVWSLDEVVAVLEETREADGCPNGEDNMEGAAQIASLRPGRHGRAGPARELADAVPERIVVERARAGDAGAFEVIFNRYQQRVLRIVSAIVKNPMEAEEAVQDVFSTVFEKIGGFRGESSLSTWIHRIAVNAALLRKRRDKSGASVSLDETALGSGVDGQVVEGAQVPQPRTDDPVLQEEARSVIRAAIKRLDKKYRTVLILRDVEGLSTEGTARIMDLGVPAVKTRLHRARLTLREALAGYFDRKR